MNHKEFMEIENARAEDQLALLMNFMKWVDDHNVKVHRNHTEDVARRFLAMPPKEMAKPAKGGGYTGPSDCSVSEGLKS
tara:strand:- start:385 stop:621 length:237 start_codon:yes stop_codon:yes gene_type:complete